MEQKPMQLVDSQQHGKMQSGESREVEQMVLGSTDSPMERTETTPIWASIDISWEVIKHFHVRHETMKFLGKQTSEMFEDFRHKQWFVG